MARKILSEAQLSAVARLFAALAEPSRLALLQALRERPQSVTQLIEACSMKQANVSKHLAILHDHHLVSRQRDGATVRYEVIDPTVFALCDLVCGKMQRDVKEAASVFYPRI